ncbi:hypothetical protein pb186bvf_010434 [Paramecium bursaria]
MQKILFRNIYRYSAAKESEIRSVPGHKPPAYEETVQGKYAGVLFSVASQKESLHTVLADMKYLKELYETSPEFQQFLLNTSYKRHQQREVFKAITKVNLFQLIIQEGFHELTLNFLESVIDNQRVQFLAKTADKYIEYYRILNKEENITIISAYELSEQEKQQVQASLKEQNENVSFTVAYKVDASILGGLQMYSGNKFLDCSLLSRVNKLRSELQKLSV